MDNWAGRLNVTERWPFFDVVTVLEPSWSLDAGAEAVLSKMAEERLFSFQIETALRWYLRWTSFVLTHPRPEPDLADPYEALLVLFERGGTFEFEHGYAFCGGIGIPLFATATAKRSDRALDDTRVDPRYDRDYLDALDAAEADA